MSEFTIHQASYKDGRLHEVITICRDAAEPPMFFHDETVQPLEHVLSYLKNGKTVWAQWEAGSIPVQIVIRPNGEESIEVMRRGQSEGYRTLASLPCEERIFDSTSL